MLKKIIPWTACPNFLEMGCVLGGRKQKHASWKGGTQHLLKWNTPLKFNSSPLKSYRDPIGKDRLPFPPFFRGFHSLLNFRGVNPFAKKPTSIHLHSSKIYPRCASNEMEHSFGLEPAIITFAPVIWACQTSVCITSMWLENAPVFKKYVVDVYIYIHTYIYYMYKEFPAHYFYIASKILKVFETCFSWVVWVAQLSHKMGRKLTWRTVYHSQ